MDTQKSIAVDLSDGNKVIAGRIKWSAYKAVKSTIADAIGSHLGQLLGALQDGSKAPPPDVAAKLSAALDTVTETIVNGCIPAGTNTDNWTAFDWLEVRAAALAVNPLSEFQRLEGNLLAVLMPKQATAPTITSQTEQTPTGG